MNDIQIRFIFFLILCTGTRIIFAIIPQVIKKYNHIYLINQLSNIFIFILYTISIGFTIIYLGKLRSHGIETRGKPIWWNNIRPIHAITYFTAASLLIYKLYDIASVILIIDITFGLAAFTIHHFVHTNNYKRL